MRAVTQQMQIVGIKRCYWLITVGCDITIITLFSETINKPRERSYAKRCVGEITPARAHGGNKRSPKKRGLVDYTEARQKMHGRVNFNVNEAMKKENRGEERKIDIPG